MNSIKTTHSIEYTIKKSRFLGFAVPCASENDAFKVLHTIHTEYSTANHLAFAYRVLDNGQMITRFNDAGEPKGTAGKPILAHIEGKELINILIAVIRYFGGIKLGAGGLVRAYGSTAKNSLEGCKIIPYQAMTKICLEIGYEKIDQLKHELTKLDASIISQEFGVKVNLVVRLPKVNAELLKRFSQSY